MKNTYLTSHFPLISIVLFSLTLALYSERVIVSLLQEVGIYSGMVEVFSERGIQISLLFVLLFYFFMLFSALKLIADTVNEVSLLFFSRDREGSDLQKIRGGVWVFLIGSIIAVLLSFNIWYSTAAFFLACLGYFIFFVYRLGDSLSSASLVGMVFFHIFFWLTLTASVSYATLKLYNTIIASLPI
ncbi:DUF5366 family protein [Alteribacter keqinensis]|uniref:Uncharacterized protein n=1 Tax=Alteribacter keqinensis TaxID=2483800 RepID=A0A3M7TT55_9BACI|nr:DUF5366 family protein [Alteribacter keqinensis]RNA68469.1 hypothetical protein EBO34_00385 [Alteribacter keqinensis]